MAKALKPLPVKTFPIPEGIQFVEIDPATGTLARESSKETRTEVFSEGTLPERPSGLTANPLDFYEFDQIVETVDTNTVDTEETDDETYP